MLIRALQAAAGNFGVAGYNIDNSLRFNDNDSAYLSRTPSSTSDTRTWTWSGWVKRGNIGVRQFLFSAGTDGNNHTFLRFNSTDDIYFVTVSGGSVYGEAKTLSVFRDPVGWYHITIAFDASNATGSNRLKIYVNGEEQTISITDTIENNTNYHKVNRSNAHNIGARAFVNTSDMLDAYLAEINFIDGQALTADDFGQIDATTGEWSPKRYSGTYGTNGFYLPFNGNANDDSGNGNNWTENNLASTDYMIDTPTNNFSVLNPLDKSTATILSEGNLKTSLSSPPGGDVIAYGTVGVSSGKWYMETTLNDFSYPVNGAAGIFGMHDGSNRVGATYSTGITSWYAYSEGAFTALSFNGSAIGMVMQIAIDLDAGKLWVGKDGVWNGSGDPDTGANPDRTFTPSGTYKMSAEPYRDGVGYWLLTVNAGADSSFAGIKTRQGNTDANGKGDFYYTPPTGYLALCTDNLPEPTIVDSETQFNVVTYTGDGNTGRTVTGVGFQPDFVWLKERNNAAAHFLYDSVRGATLGIHTNLTDAEATYTDGLTSFDTDGFTVGSRSNNNGLGDTYVAWCWKAGGTAVTNTDGTITSQVSANVDAGFSIVEYTGSGSSGSTVGHGLNGAPDFVLIKSSSHVTNWLAYHSSTPSGYYYVNSTAGLQSASWFSSNTDTFTLNNTYGDANTSGRTYIAYCFHGVEGFSKFGSYVGNGSTDGPFVYTGFRPAFVLVKSSSLAGSYWHIMDAKRNEYNVADKLLYPNVADAEGTGLQKDFLSNGFKIRSTATWANGSGQTYIYMAFAEHPFNYSTGR